MNYRATHVLSAVGPGLLAAVLCLMGCTDVGKCEIGTEGCMGEGSGGTGGSGGSGGSGGDGGSPADGGVTPADCGGESLEEGCTLFCEAFCQTQEGLCQDSSCVPGDCSPGDQTVYQVCIDTCDDQNCANNLCEVESGRTCEDFGFMDEELFVAGCFLDDPVCTLAPENGCSDTCGGSDGVGGDFANDGTCDDGTVANGDQLCPSGTDCTDCGACLWLGGACEDEKDCCGFPEGEATCVGTMDGPQCLEFCTASEPCPASFACVDTEDGTSVCVPL